MASIIKMYLAGTGGAENASIDVPQDGLIMGVKWAADFDGDADGDQYTAQLSFGSAANFATNDVRQVISETKMQANLATSGASLAAINQFESYANGLPVAQGERLFLHVTSTASTASRTTCMVIFDFDEPRPSTRRR